MGFRSLRVINEDRVAPGGGFPTHPHRDMEIFSYIVSGSLEHRDSLGNGRRLSPGQIQLMSTGSGVRHSEFNPSSQDPVHFLQIWILPSRTGLEPSYTEWHPEAPSVADKILVISADGRDNSAIIHQDADVFLIRLDSRESCEHILRSGRAFWFQTIAGSASINGEHVEAGDGAFTEDSGKVILQAITPLEGLLFDLR
jgi:quercetin 2,3-dioxygenase